MEMAYGTKVHWYQPDGKEEWHAREADPGRARPDGRAHGEAAGQGAQGAGRVPRRDLGRSARGHRAARLRGKEPLRRAVAAADPGAEALLPSGPRCRGEPPAGGDDDRSLIRTPPRPACVIPCPGVTG